MKGGHHRFVGAAVAAVSLHLAPVSALGGVAVMAISVATAGGPASPDADNTPSWRKLDKWVPDEWLGDGGPLGHRRLLHWWGLPVLLLWACSAYPPLAAGLGPWPVRGIATGWLAHIAADALYGHGGVPLLGWSWRVGLHLPQDGALARGCAWACLAITGYALATLIPALAPWWPSLHLPHLF